MKAKKCLSISLSLLAVVLSAIPSYAEDNKASEATLSDISLNCSSIKLQLERIQKEDSRQRVHLGAQYETISSNLMQNLNLRLVRNNLANADLSIQQTSFYSERERFKNDFVSYSQEMDKLIAIDCRTKPDKFYEQLQLVRWKRSVIQSDTVRLKDAVKKHYNSVNAYKDELYNKTEAKEGE